MVVSEMEQFTRNVQCKQFTGNVHCKQFTEDDLWERFTENDLRERRNPCRKRLASRYKFRSRRMKRN